MNTQELIKEIVEKRNRVITEVVKSGESRSMRYLEVSNLDNILKIEKSGIDIPSKLEYTISIEVEETENLEVIHTVIYRHKLSSTDTYTRSPKFEIKMSEGNIRELIKMYDTILSIVDAEITQDLRISSLLKSINE